MPRVAISKHLKKVRKALAPKSINTNAGVAISQPVLTHMGFNPDILSDAKLMPLHVAAKRQSVTQRGFKVTIQQEEAKSPLVTSNKIKPAAALEELETCEESFVEISLQRSGSSTPSSLETRVNDSASGLPFNVGNSSKHSLSPFLDMSWEHPSTSSSRSSWALLPTSDAIQDQETCEKDFSAWDEFAICQDLSKELMDETIKEEDISLWIDQMLEELASEGNEPSHPFVTSAADFPEPVTYTHPLGPCASSDRCSMCIITRSLPPQFPPNFAYAMKLVTLATASKRDDIRCRPEGFELMEQPPKALEWPVRKNVDTSYIDINRFLAN